MRLYGDEIYRQNVDTLYDLGKEFAEMVKRTKNMELALEPCSNIVCFRYAAEGIDCDEANRRIAEELLKDGSYYVVSTEVKDRYYLRITLMNPLTDRKCLEELIRKVQETAENI